MELKEIINKAIGVESQFRKAVLLQPRYAPAWFAFTFFPLLYIRNLGQGWYQLFVPALVNYGIGAALYGKALKIPMNDRVRSAIRNLPVLNEFIFFNRQTQTRIKSIRKSFLSACTKAKIKDVTPHALRHTAATRMINDAGVDVFTASKILGHSDIKMTLRYCHPSEETMQRAVVKLGETYEKSGHEAGIAPDLHNYQSDVSHLETYS